MKYLLIALVSGSLLFSACKKETETTSDIPVNDMVDQNTTLVVMGNFTAGPYGSAGGTAEVRRASNGSLTLVLKNFTVNNGPDLHVYLSKEVQPLNFIDLGLLRSTSGTQTYTINGNPDFSQFKFALIHCQRFNHLFGSAELKQ
jgi:hypothetical protein